MMNIPALLSDAEVAQLLGVSLRHVRQLARDEQLSCVDLGNDRLRFDPAAVQAFIDARRVGPALPAALPSLPAGLPWM